MTGSGCTAAGSLDAEISTCGHPDGFDLGEAVASRSAGRCGCRSMRSSPASMRAMSMASVTMAAHAVGLLAETVSSSAVVESDAAREQGRAADLMEVSGA